MGRGAEAVERSGLESVVLVAADRGFESLCAENPDD
jgi:hypothetical protein